MLSIFEYWVKGCELNNTDLWCLEGEGDTALYKTQSWKLVNNNYYGNTPVYHVWINGKCEISVTDYQAAYGLYQRRIQELEGRSVGGKEVTDDNPPWDPDTHPFDRKCSWDCIHSDGVGCSRRADNFCISDVCAFEWDGYKKCSTCKLRGERDYMRCVWGGNR